MTHRPNRVFELVRAIFRWAIGRDLLAVDPTLGLTPPIRKEKPRERDLSPDEIRRLWVALDKAPVGRTPRSEGDFPMTRATALAIKLALVTGQRIGEVATSRYRNCRSTMWHHSGRSPAIERRTASRTGFHSRRLP